MKNVLAATQHLANIPTHGNSPDEQKARGEVALLNTAVAQQAQYSHGFSYLHGTPCPTRSRQIESPTRAVSRRHHRQKEPSGQETQQASRLPTTGCYKPRASGSVPALGGRNRIHRSLGWKPVFCAGSAK